VRLAFPLEWSRLGGAALLVVFPLALGAALVNEPRLAPMAVLLVAVAVWVVVRGQVAWWDLLVFAVAGAYVLDLGFANIGVPGPFPLPLVDLIAALLIVRAATRPGFRWPATLPFVLAAAFVALTAIRLVVDYPTYGGFALRDTTLAFELAFLFIGFWAVREYGLERISRVLAVAFAVGLAYTAFYPFRDAIEAVSPVVGLQRPVPLFGNFVGNTVVVAAFFYFAIVRPFGSRSYYLAAAALPLMVLLQSRGWYIAVPAAILLVVLLGRARTGKQVRRGLAATLAVGAVGLALFFPIAPEGRVGQVSPSFVVAQLATLSGREGPGADVDQRREWADKVLEKVNATPSGQVFGVGLGPDLALGFENPQGGLVRKPHNDYLEIYARLGALGLALFVGMFGSAFLQVARAARRTGGLEGRFLLFTVAQTTVIGFIAATQPLLAFPYGTVPLFFVLGGALAVAERPRGTAR
jgi:O-antigen ligase